jgi:glycosyltransferase involved in cell wall biosynthesis
LRARRQVSVIIPTHDRSDVLPVTLASVLWQRGLDLQVIVIDDGSTDGTSEMVSRFTDPRIRLLRLDRRGGMAAARNRGIVEAVGEWIAFLDDDDLWASDKLVRQIEAAEQAGRGWVYAGDVNVDADLRVLSGAPPPAPEEVMATLPRYNSVPTGSSNVVVRAEILGRAGRFDPALHRIADWDMWLRLSRIGPPACVLLPLVAYRFHSSNIAVETRSMIKEPEVLARKHSIHVDRAAMHRWAAWSWLRAGRRGKAMGHYVRAISLGDLRSLARAIVALTHPAVGSDRVFGLLRNRPQDAWWRDRAQEWLDELASGSLPPGEV